MITKAHVESVANQNNRFSVELLVKVAMPIVNKTVDHGFNFEVLSYC